MHSSSQPRKVNEAFNFQEDLGIMPGSAKGTWQDGRLKCSFSHLIRVNSSEPESSKVKPLDKSYYILMASGIVDKEGLRVPIEGTYLIFSYRVIRRTRNPACTARRKALEKERYINGNKKSCQ